MTLPIACSMEAVEGPVLDRRNEMIGCTLLPGADSAPLGQPLNSGTDFIFRRERVPARFGSPFLWGSELLLGP